MRGITWGGAFRFGSICKRPIFNPGRTAVAASNPIKARYAHVEREYVPESGVTVPLTGMSNSYFPAAGLIQRRPQISDQILGIFDADG